MCFHYMETCSESRKHGKTWKVSFNIPFGQIFLPFQVVQKALHCLIRSFPAWEIFKDPLNWKSSGSRRGHRHFLWGSLTQRGNGCPLIGLLIVSAVLWCCEITLCLLQICPYVPWGHHHRNKSDVVCQGNGTGTVGTPRTYIEFIPMPFVNRQCSSVLPF